jgi:hypothetical protein
MGNSECYEFGKFDAARVNRVVIIYVCKACAFHAKSSFLINRLGQSFYPLLKKLEFFNTISYVFCLCRIVLYGKTIDDVYYYLRSIKKGAYFQSKVNVLYV